MSASRDMVAARTPVQVPGDVTVCVTSCGRLDLLDQTLSSFLAFNHGPRLLISEDSTGPGIISEVERRYPDATVLSGQQRLGLMGSIDRLYGAVSTPYIFHLEDDWIFDGPVDWEAAKSLLHSNAGIANVSLRAFDEIKPRFRQRSTMLDHAERSFAVMRVDAHPEFFGWSSNPGLIRRDLYERYKPFARLMHDQMSGLIKSNGQTVAYLLPGVARHIGQGRNVTDPQMPARPKNKIAKLLRAVRKKLYYAGLRKEPF